MHFVLSACQSTSAYGLRSQKHRPACFAAHLGVGSLDYSLGRIAIFEICLSLRSSAALGTSPQRRARAFNNQPNSSLRNSFNCPYRAACAVLKSSCPPSVGGGLRPQKLTDRLGGLFCLGAKISFRLPCPNSPSAILDALLDASHRERLVNLFYIFAFLLYSEQLLLNHLTPLALTIIMAVLNFKGIGMQTPVKQKKAIDQTRALRQKNFAERKRKSGLRKYSFWLSEASAVVVRSVAILTSSAYPESEKSDRFGDMVNSIASAFKCDNAQAVMMAVTRMYASLNPLNNEFDYPSEEARADMVTAEPGEPVVSGKTLADVLII